MTTNFPQGSYAFAVALQPDGKIIAAGTVFRRFHPWRISDTDFALARYHPDGTPDATFGSGGQVSTDFLGIEDDAFSILIQPDGKIVAVGSANDPATSTTSPRRVISVMARSTRPSASAGKCGQTSAIKTSIGRARPPCNPMAGSSRLGSPFPISGDPEFRGRALYLQRRPRPHL